MLQQDSPKSDESLASEDGKLISIVAQTNVNGIQIKPQIRDQSSRSVGFFSALCSCFAPRDEDLMDSEENRQELLPPQCLRKLNKKTLVLDLDETLVHSSFRPVEGFDIQIEVQIEGRCHPVFVNNRPGAHELLEQLSTYYELVIFTASLAKYANPLLDKLDPLGFIDYRLFRDSCSTYRGAFVKDLSRLGRDMKNIIIIDNSPMSFFFQPENAILSKSWFEDRECRDLFKLIPLLQGIADCEDVRDGIKTMNRPEQLITERQPPEEAKYEESGPKLEMRGVFNSPKAQETVQKKFAFQEDSEFDEEDSNSSCVAIE